MNIPMVQNVLAESEELALENQKILEGKRVFTINMMSSPGAGKTAILSQTIPLLKSQGLRCAVIEGDITSTLDSERIGALNVPVVQVNTAPFGGDCHIGPHFIHAALDLIDLDAVEILFVENVGNLVCPAEFNLGEHRKVVVLSLPEGEDKPLKYPLMFRECHLCLLNKIDLTPHLDVDQELLKSNLRRINSQLKIIPVSAKTGSGIEDWAKWLLESREDKFR